MKLAATILLVSAAALAGCGGTPCSSMNDCPTGSYCDSRSRVCTQECFENSDCPQASDNLSIALCSREGRCKIARRPPKLRVLEPENDTLLAEGTRSVRISGEVETAAETVVITADPQRVGNCLVGKGGTAVVKNLTPGSFATIPFVIDGIDLDPGFNVLTVNAMVENASKRVTHALEIPCPGCATIQVNEPSTTGDIFTAPALELPRLTGTISPATVRTAVWRVRNDSDDVFDGTMSVENGNFTVTRLPLFPGRNRIEVVVSGVGEGLGEARCSTPVVSAVGREEGLRVVLSWDGRTSDLDLHVIAPGGRFGDRATALSSRNDMLPNGATLNDDFDGLGPEVARVPQLEDGVYGLIVEPVFDDTDPGSNAILRLTYEGRSLTRGAVGPRFLTALPGDLWIVGTLTVVGGTVVMRVLDATVPGNAPPTKPPSMWPTFY